LQRSRQFKLHRNEFFLPFRVRYPPPRTPRKKGGVRVSNTWLTPTQGLLALRILPTASWNSERRKMVSTTIATVARALMAPWVSISPIERPSIQAAKRRDCADLRRATNYERRPRIDLLYRAMVCSFRGFVCLGCWFLGRGWNNSIIYIVRLVMVIPYF